MGGKPKQAQRTKNNARPSSSGRSAELLSNVKLDSGLVSIAGGKVLPALFPTLTVAALDQEITPEFQMCIKKLNKKDPITKTKGLQELSDLVNYSKVDDVIAILPSWAHFYNILTTDTERKVREYTQLCHSIIVKTCGRKVAPQLKQVLGAWLQAQYDEHGPAQTHARNSLTSTFPDAKLPEVVAFCKTEVMAHFIDNLTGNGEAVISKKTDSVEEKEVQTSRVMSSTLLGAEYFVQQLAAAHDDWLWSQLAALLKQNAFWKLATHNSTQIRAAWFALIGRIIERFKSTFSDEFGVKTLRVVIGAANESNVLVAAQLWSCLLVYMHSVDDWYKHLENRDLLVKRIFELLENGGWGDAKLLATMLLPLLAHLPNDILTKDFYIAFFDAIFAGLDKKNIFSSKSERQSWITGLAECLRYLSLQQDSFVTELVTSVHRTWLTRTLANTHQHHANTMVKHSTNSMASIVKYWHKQTDDKYHQLIRNFWQNCCSTLLGQIEKLGDDIIEIGNVIDGQILFIQTLKCSFLNEPKKQQSIKFEMDGSEPGSEVPTPQTSPVHDPAALDRFKHNLNDLVQKVVANYFEFANKNNISDPVLSPIITLLKEFDSKQLFMAVVEHFNAGSLIGLYEYVLEKWLKNNAMCSRSVVDIVFHFMKYMNENELDLAFTSFEQLSGECEEWCMERSAGDAWSRRPPAARYLRAPARTPALVRTPALLTACLAHEILISKEAVSEILSSLTSSLEARDSPLLESRCRMSSALATTLPREYHDHNYTKMLYTLFRLNLHVPLSDGRLSLDTWREVRSSWQDGVGALLSAHRARLLGEIAEYINDALFDKTKSLQIKQVENITYLCPYLLNKDDSIPTKLDEMIEFTKLLFSTNNDAVESYAVRHDCIQSNFNSPFKDDRHMKKIIEEADTEVTELNDNDLTLYVNKCVFRALYLKELLLHETEDDEPKLWCTVLLRDKYFGLEFCKILYDYMVICTLNEAYAFSPLHMQIIKAAKPTIDLVISETIKKTPRPLQLCVLSNLTQLAASYGYYWSKARRHYELNIDTEDLEKEKPFDTANLNLEKMAEIVTGNGFFHSLQANLRECTDEEADARAVYLVMIRSVYAAHGSERDVLDQRFLHDLARCHPSCGLDVVLNLYYRHNHVMLYDRDVWTATWQQVSCNAAVCECLRALVVRRGWTGSAAFWDFLTITLCSLLSSLQLTKARWGSTKYALLARSVLRLYRATEEFISGVDAQCTRRTPSQHVAALPAEWRDIFAPDLHANLFALVVHVLQSHETEIKSTHISTIEELMLCTRQMDWNSLPKEHQVNTHALSRLVRTCTETLAATVVATAEATPAATCHHAYKYLAACVLEMIAEPMVLEDVGKLSIWSESTSDDKEEYEENDRPQLSLDYVREHYAALRDAVREQLAPYTVGEAICKLDPLSASHSACLGWLLLADSVHRQCRVAKGELTHYYTHIYKDNNYGAPLIEACLMLLPEEILTCIFDNKPLPAHYATCFLNSPTPTLMATPAVDTVEWLSCRVVSCGVRGAACVAARGWRGAASARQGRVLDALLQHYISPPAIKEQLDLVLKRGAEIEDTEIQVLPSAGEVLCVYRAEGRGVELRIELARDHPVGAPRITPPPPGSPGANTHWMAVYLAYQSGTVLDALRLWRRSCEDKIGRSAQCYICYCVLHPNTGTLPRVVCFQCKNKFHKECLRKWFVTSNKSSCPLCRASF